MPYYTHVLIQPDEDGRCVTFLTDEKLRDLLDDPIGEYGVRRFIQLGDVTEQISEGTSYVQGEPLVGPVGYDPQSWPEGTALLLRVESVRLRTVTTAWEIAR